MKRCPTCNRTFEDTLTYCLIDGSILSAPFTLDAEAEQNEATQVLVSNEGLTAKPDTVARDMPPAPTMTAMYQPPVMPRVDLPETVATTEKKPYLWLATVAVTALFFLVAIVVLMVLDRREMASYTVFMLARRSPFFLLALIGIILAVVRMKRHPRTSMMTILALVILALEGAFFPLLLRWLSYSLNLSSTAIDRLFTVGSVIQDFVFSSVIILLVAAAYSGRNRFRNLTHEAT
jgi:hypothetical protein